MTHRQLTFARDSSGALDFSERKLAPLVAQLRPMVDQNDCAVLPVELLRAAEKELVRDANSRTDGDPGKFTDALKRVCIERPNLYWLTRGWHTKDDRQADIVVSDA
jgi:hypothetical protein